MFAFLSSPHSLITKKRGKERRTREEEEQQTTRPLVLSLRLSASSFSFLLFLPSTFLLFLTLVLETVLVELGNVGRSRQVLLRGHAIPGLDRDTFAGEIEDRRAPTLRLGDGEVVVLDGDSGRGLDKRGRDVELPRGQLDPRALDLDERRLDVDQLRVCVRARRRNLDEARREVEEARRARRASDADVDEAGPDVDEVGADRGSLDADVEGLGSVAPPGCFDFFCLRFLFGERKGGGGAGVVRKKRKKI